MLIEKLKYNSKNTMKTVGDRLNTRKKYLNKKYMPCVRNCLRIKWKNGMDIITKMSRKTDPRSVLYRRNRWLELDSPHLSFY